MKRFGLILLALACLIGCAGCFCGHQWVEGDCLTPRSCPLCGKVDGEAPGHRWREATCQAPETCDACGETRGQPVDHQWQAATCASPKRCVWCDLTQGQALDHTWQADTTEAPKTCTGCGLTEGERILTDERFATAANEDLFGQWRGETVLTGADLRLEEYVEQVPVIVTVTFEEDGSMEKSFSVKDLEGLTLQLIDITQQRMYQQFREMNIDREEADVLFEDAYSMTIEEYAVLFWENARMLLKESQS